MLRCVLNVPVDHSYCSADRIREFGLCNQLNSGYRLIACQVRVSSVPWYVMHAKRVNFSWHVTSAKISAISESCYGYINQDQGKIKEFDPHCRI